MSVEGQGDMADGTRARARSPCSSGMVTLLFRSPAVSACAFMVPICHDSLRGQRAEIKGESIGRLPSVQAQLAPPRDEPIEIPRALGGHATCSAIARSADQTS